jgi:hypothetical protein
VTIAAFAANHEGIEVGAMRTLSRVSIAVLLAAALAWASDPWEGKPYRQWTQKDVSKVLNDSPWVRIATVGVSWRGGPSGEDSGGGSRHGMGRGQGGGSGAMAAEDVFEARWLSSVVIREGMARQQILSGVMTQEQADRLVAEKLPDYELVLYGQDMTPLERMSEAGIAKDSYLEAKESKQKLGADKVGFERGANGKVAAIVFFFPKTANGTPLVGPQEKEIDFSVDVEEVSLKFRFDPRKMSTKDGLDL